jgi:hypothetical protein
VDLAVFVLATYGASNIVVCSKLFEPIRRVAPGVIKRLLSCIMCCSFWVGAVVRLVYLGAVEAATPSLGDAVVLGVLYGFIGSGSAWAIHVSLTRLGADKL